MIKIDKTKMNMEGNIKSCCDVINDIIMVKTAAFYMIYHFVFISEIKLKLSFTQHGLGKRFRFSAPDDFQTEPHAIFECVR